jgi:AraC family transcriptional activator of pobA
MRTMIPSYALYGECSELNWDNFFNMEWISYRSQRYDWNIEPHLHNSLIQVLFLQHGTAEIILNYAKHHVQAPCLVIVPAQTVHSLHYQPDSEGLTITTSQKLLESIVRQILPDVLTLLHEPRVIPLNQGEYDDEKILELYLSIQRELKIPAVGQIAMCASLFAALFIQIFRISHIAHEQSQGGSSNRKAIQIEKFLKMVEEKFRMRLSIDDYANEMGMTPGHLSRLCRIALGTSSSDIINMRVIQEAQRELVYTSKTIKQLAASLGFSDEAYFTRFFRKHVSMSPKKFRDQAMQRIFLEDGHPPAKCPDQPDKPLINEQEPLH